MKVLVSFVRINNNIIYSFYWVPYIYTYNLSSSSQHPETINIWRKTAIHKLYIRYIEIYSFWTPVILPSAEMNWMEREFKNEKRARFTWDVGKNVIYFQFRVFHHIITYKIWISNAYYKVCRRHSTLESRVGARRRYVKSIFKNINRFRTIIRQLSVTL